MKRALCFFLLLSFLLSAAGCTQPQQPTGENNAQQGGNQDFVPQQQPMIALSLPASTQYARAENGDILFQYTSQEPHLILNEPDVANKVKFDLTNRIVAHRDNAENLLQMAKAAYPYTSSWTPYLLQTSLDPMRIDHSVLSLLFTHIEYTGGSHPNRTCKGANYDLLNGDILTLANILTNEDKLPQLHDLVLEEMSKHKAELGLYEFYDDVVRQRFKKDPSTDELFYFSTTGLCFFFDPMEVAPYSSGVVNVEIPYNKLVGILYESYFPDEQDSVRGELLISQNSRDSFTQTAELSITQGADCFFLYTDTAVRNVRLQVGTMNYNATKFNVDYTAFATEVLTPGDAIMVEISIPEVYPNLRLIYESGTETVIRYIGQSGIDSSIILIEP